MGDALRPDGQPDRQEVAGDPSGSVCLRVADAVLNGVGHAKLAGHPDLVVGEVDVAEVEAVPCQPAERHQFRHGRASRHDEDVLAPQPGRDALEEVPSQRVGHHVRGWAVRRVDPLADSHRDRMTGGIHKRRVGEDEVELVVGGPGQQRRMLGQHPVEVDCEPYYRLLLLLHVILPALPASSIIPEHVDDVTHSDEQRLHELLPQLELSQSLYGQDDARRRREQPARHERCPFSTRHATIRAPSVPCAGGNGNDTA